MDPVIHANILELLGAFFLGATITIVMFFTLFNFRTDALDYYDGDDDDDSPDAPAIVPA